MINSVIFFNLLTALYIYIYINQRGGTVPQQRLEYLSIGTISRALHSAGRYGRVARRKPLLSAKNKKAPFEFAKRHVGDSQNVWRKVLWSDETKV